jgi:hypothetical protein
VKTEATNDHRQRVSEDLRAKKKVAQEMLAAFEKATPKKQLALAKEPEKLKAYINKKLFKKDAIYSLDEVKSSIMTNQYIALVGENKRLILPLLYNHPKTKDVINFFNNKGANIISYLFSTKIKNF